MHLVSGHVKGRVGRLGTSTRKHSYADNFQPIRHLLSLIINLNWNIAACYCQLGERECHPDTWSWGAYPGLYGRESWCQHKKHSGRVACRSHDCLEGPAWAASVCKPFTVSLVSHAGWFSSTRGILLVICLTVCRPLLCFVSPLYRQGRF
jgi:hypothetical protein